MIIGVAALLLLWLAGRIAGVSGLLSGLMTPTHGEWLWRGCFILGLLIGGEIGFSLLGEAKPDLTPVSPWLLLLAGLLVGIGTRLGNGCTSGHGICGVGRLSPRSMVATLCFMTTAAITVFVLRHLL
ncbi:MAG: YeeE/YedE family protein [Aeromonadaceae bacterium]|nr:YeeE/YedE family protein [Aeromonadaceae bacterium]